MITADFSYLTILLISLAFLPFTTCDRNPKNEKAVKSPTAKQKNLEIQLPAMFSGTLPCADCPGINYRLIIEEDSFTEISNYQDRSSGRIEKTGRWISNGDTLNLQSNNTIIKKFLINKSELTLLDQKNQEITGSLSDRYVLERVGNQPSIRQHHQDLADQGFTFFAGGNEPFWSLKVDSTNHIIFETPDSSMNFQQTNSSKSDSIVVLEAISDSNEITIQAKNEYCQDSMSGYLFPKTVSVYLKTARTDTLTGCGLFLNR